ncbi:MAG: hydantoinase B/oxoprolinase family protein, partial [Actinobacteria bacterium]|nr:hydantoinase B/oxoprolinase family protein [Actinomycetota bacterium]
MTTASETPLDLVELEIFSRAMDGIANEMGTVMMRTSGSPVVAEAVDFSTFIADAGGEIIAFAGYITLHVGPARQAVRYVLENTPQDEIRPGDAFICNDTHTTGNAHQPDVGILRPIFRDDLLVAWCWAEAHTYDVGGMSPGGFAPLATEVYAEALRFPGTKIVDRGKIIRDIWRLIETNVRIPALVLNDIRSLIAACNTANDRLGELIDNYGLATFHGYNEAAKDLAEAALRRRIATIPDGSWQAVEHVEHNGHVNDLYRVSLTATVEGDQLTLDFRDSAPQTDGFVNCPQAVTLGTALTPLLMTLVPDVPINEGTIRAIDVITTPGTVCHVQMPGPTSSGHMETGLRVMKTVEAVLAQMQALSTDPFVREHVMATWHDCWPGGVFYAPLETGELVPFLDMHGGSGGGGAQPIADGQDVCSALCQPSSSLPDIEVNEFQFPVLYLWRRINAGSGGAGRLRGGQGIDLAWTPWYTPGGQEFVFVSCWQVPPPGIEGGYPGSASGFDVVTGAGADELLAAGSVPTRLSDLRAAPTALDGKHYGMGIGPGDVVHMHSGGGGGLGDPLDRETELVADDVRVGAITANASSEVYGVVLDI